MQIRWTKVDKNITDKTGLLYDQTDQVSETEADPVGCKYNPVSKGPTGRHRPRTATAVRGPTATRRPFAIGAVTGSIIEHKLLLLLFLLMNV